MYSKEEIAELVIEHVRKKEKELDLKKYKKQLIEHFRDPIDGEWIYHCFLPVTREFNEEQIKKILKKPDLRIVK